MKPKFYPVLEMCIENGVSLGLRRAFKHDDNPSEEAIQAAVVTAVMNEIYDWFDMDSGEDTTVT
jgi:hypothetical protein